MIQHPPLPIGFIGLGTMGEPMALNLVRSGAPLVVWNRTFEKTRRLQQAGANTAADVAELFGRTKTVILMLSTSEAIDAVLGRAKAEFASLVAGHLVVNMGSTLPLYSQDLDRDLRSAGARYIEAPVSGDRASAETGQLFGLLGGDENDLEAVGPLLAAMCSATLPCGSVPLALSTKLASNAFVLTMQVCLAEAVNYARCSGVDLGTFSALMSVGPMSSDFTRQWLPKLVDGDFVVRSSLDVTLDAVRLIVASAKREGSAVPVLALAERLYTAAKSFEGPAAEDFTSVIRAFEQGFTLQGA